MKYRTLTVAREFGSDGAELARRFDERVDSWLHRVARKGLWSGAFEAMATPSAGAVFDAETTAALATKLICEAKEQGECVIVGRAAQCALRRQEDVFHLFVYAPKAARSERLRTRAGAPEDLEAWMVEMDKMRSEYVRRNFGCEWANPHLYRLMIDSSLGMEASEEAVLAAMEAPREAGSTRE